MVYIISKFIGYLLKVSAVKSILGASNISTRPVGKMYSDSDRSSPRVNNRLGMVHEAAKKAALSTRLGGGDVASRLGPKSNQTVTFNKNSL